MLVSVTTRHSPLLVIWILGPILAGAALVLLGFWESLLFSPLVLLLLLPPDLDLDFLLDLDLISWELPLLPSVRGRLVLVDPRVNLLNKNLKVWSYRFSANSNRLFHSSGDDIG